MFFARIAGYGISRAMRGDRDERDSGMSHLAYTMTVFLFEILFGILGSMVVAWFSRYREFRADAGGASLPVATRWFELCSASKRIWNCRPKRSARRRWRPSKSRRARVRGFTSSRLTRRLKCV